MENKINYNAVILGSLAVIGFGFFRYHPEINESVWETILQIIQSIAYLVLGISVFRKARLEKVSKKKIVSACLILFLASTSFQLKAQSDNYSKQIKALKTSFESKNIEALKDYISSELKFRPIPAQNTIPILTNVTKQFPKLIEMRIIETKEGEALVFYNFEGMGEAESKILFDESGKITKIEYIENVVIESIKAQQAAQNSVQQPNPGELSKKYQPKSIEFESKDGLLVSGNLYEVNPKNPVILLLHQAGYNKYEYADIAPKLNEMGYNVLAIDQRSGGSSAGKNNETFERATKRGDTDISFVDAEQDIEAAVDYLNSKYGKKVTVWGSSYSSALAIFVGANNDHVNGIISFSPGNYFGDAKPTLHSIFKELDKPFLVTSSKEEAVDLSSELEGLELNDNQAQFIPTSNGFHGSRAIWEGQKGADEYWATIIEFLNTIYPNHKKELK